MQFGRLQLLCLLLGISFSSGLDIDTASVELVLPKISFFSTEPVFLRCNTSLLNSNLQFQFFKNGNNITDIQNKTSTIYNTMLSDNDNNFTCSVKINDKVKTSPPKSWTVYLLNIPRVYYQRVGDDVNLTCFIFATPNSPKEPIASYIWKILDKTNLTLTDQTSEFLEVKNLQKSDDKKQFYCAAVSEYGITSKFAAQTIYVFYNDQPNVTTTASNYKKETNTASLNCQGDSNIFSAATVKWFQNGIELANETGNQLYWRHVQRTNTGNYTCSRTVTQFALTLTSPVSSPFDLIVAYLDAPNITYLENSKQHVKEGDQVVLYCAAHVYYHELKLTYQWTRGAVRELVGSSQELRITAKGQQDNLYKCTVDGRFDNILISKSAEERLTVDYVPKNVDVRHIYLIKENGIYIEKIRRNETFSRTFYAKTYGQPPAALQIYKNDVFIKNGSIGSELTYNITGVDLDDIANYTCKAKNYVGESSVTLELQVTGVPGIPENLTVTKVTDTRIDFQWIPPSYTGGHPIQLYWIRYGLKGTELEQTTITASKNTDFLRYLKPGRTYVFQLRAENTLGVGKYTELVAVQTKTVDVPSEPFDFKQSFDTTGPRMLCVQWLAPQYPNGALNGYDLCYYKATEKPEDAMRCKMQNETKANLTSLETYTEYVVTVRAKNNFGFGPKATIKLTTPEEAPSPVRDVKYVPDQYELTFSWSPPLNINGKLRLYKEKGTSQEVDVKNQVEYKGPTDTNWQTGCFTTASTTCEVKDLKVLTTYAIKVTVENQNFESDAVFLNATTYGEAPPPLNKEVPAPKQTKNTLEIKIVRFNESRGPLQHYDIFAMPLNSLTKPGRKPNNYPESDIKDYRVGRLVNPTEDQVFVIGSGDTSRRRRALGEPSNPPLKSDTIYGVFVRGYVAEFYYQSSPWYKPVKIGSGDDDGDGDGGLSGGAIAGIIIAVILLVALIIFVFIYFARAEKRKVNKEEKAGVRLNAYGSTTEPS